MERKKNKSDFSVSRLTHTHRRFSVLHEAENATAVVEAVKFAIYNNMYI